MSQGIKTEHVPNLRHCELHINYSCNLRCAHCSNHIDIAPSQEVMPLERIAWFLNESVRLNWPWEWLVLHGGEPTVNPSFETICAMLALYKSNHNSNVTLYVCTNGYGEFVQKQHEVARRYGVGVENSKKDGSSHPQGHVPMHYSPEDLGEDYNLGCFQSSSCGIAFNNRGFYECSPAASAHRIFGYKPIATRLEDLTVENLSKGFEEHCKHCGYARINYSPDPHAPLTQTWQKAVQEYKHKHANTAIQTPSPAAV